MYHYTVENMQAANNSCVPACCCEPVAIRPGTIDRLTVNYAPWSVPVGQLHCLPQFALEQMETCPVLVGSNMPPQVSPEVKYNTGVNVHLDGNFGDHAVDPEGAPLTYKVLPLYGPKFGKLQLDPNGPFAYDPALNYKGQERFYVSVTDGVNAPVIFEVMIAIGIDSGTMHPTPHIVIGTPTVNKDFHTVSIPVALMPNADPCEIWRLTVLQAAVDCGCQCYTRTDCFDIKVASC